MSLMIKPDCKALFRTATGAERECLIVWVPKIKGARQAPNKIGETRHGWSR
jgi:hypothetical protein